MGQLYKFFIDWIDDIPNNKLEGGMRTAGKVHSDLDARLDVQGMVVKDDGSRWYNLQVQANKGTKSTSLATGGSRSYAWFEAPVNPEWTATQIKASLKATVTGRPLKRPGSA